MQQRLDYVSAAPEGYKAFGGVHKYVAKSLDESLVNLVYLRVSQINGCAYCVDLHTRDAIKAGESQRRLHNVVTWREAPFFSERERAAFAWAESLTLVAKTGAPDADYDAVRQHFDDKELADLTYAIALMNAFNRLGVGFRKSPPPDSN
jgi:AhpD family alkylhydroperoxidase